MYHFYFYFFVCPNVFSKPTAICLVSELRAGIGHWTHQATSATQDDHGWSSTSTPPTHIIKLAFDLCLEDRQWLSIHHPTEEGIPQVQNSLSERVPPLFPNNVMF